MNRRSGASKENRRPAGSVSSFHQDERCSGLVRRPLGERKPSNRPGGQSPGVDVGPCLKWLEGAVAQSRAWKQSQVSGLNSASPRSPISGSKMFNSTSSSRDGSLPLANAPPAQPSRSPDFVRKKSSRDMLDGCFGVGPTVKGDVKDRRKSKPRALLTVEPLPSVAAAYHRGIKARGLPRPGRASLEWISDDQDTDSTTNTDISGACDDGSSGDSSLCCGFDRQCLDGEWGHLTASRICGKFNQDMDSDISLSKSWETLLLQESGKTLSYLGETESSPEADSRKTDSSFSLSEVDTVVGAYESCQTKQALRRTFSAYGPGLRGRAEAEPKNDQQEDRKAINKIAGRTGVCEVRPSHVITADALRKLTMERFEAGGGNSSSEVSRGLQLPNGYDSLTEQVPYLANSFQSQSVFADCCKVAVAAGFLVTGAVLAAYLYQRRLYHPTG